MTSSRRTACCGLPATPGPPASVPRAIFELTLDRLGVPATSCVFADDTEENLIPARAMGMTVIHALDEQETAACLRRLLALPGR